MKTTFHPLSFLFLFGACIPACANGQMITGVWKGKINRQKTEVKIIQAGDSLTGTVYYYESASQYRRYSIKGYFDADAQQAVWWDDQLLDEQPGRSVAAGKVPLLSRGDFNCPGGDKMLLDGTAAPAGEDPAGKPGLHLEKTGLSYFPDEWDFVIENYTSGANDPFIIDSIRAIAAIPPAPEKPLVAISAPVVEAPAPSLPPPAATIEEKFLARKKVLVTEIPVTGDSIELRFYDNAEIDGDSISLFLNERLIFRHIRLSGSAYTIKLATKELGSSSELTMVAENLGTIPPNTSYMVAVVGEKRYEARLASTEGSSAMVRLVKTQ